MLQSYGASVSSCTSFVSLRMFSDATETDLAHPVPGLLSTQVLWQMLITGWGALLAADPQEVRGTDSLPPAHLCMDTDCLTESFSSLHHPLVCRHHPPLQMHLDFYLYLAMFQHDRKGPQFNLQHAQTPGCRCKPWHQSWHAGKADPAAAHISACGAVAQTASWRPRAGGRCQTWRPPY